MLHRSSAMRPLMRNDGDNAYLRIGPAYAFDAGALSKLRALPVGTHEKTRFDLTALRQSRRHAERSRCEVRDGVWCDHFDRFFLFHGSGKSVAQIAGLDDIGNGFASLEFVIEAEKVLAQIGVQRTVGDLDRGDGLRAWRERIPQPQQRKEPLGRRRKRKRARFVRSATVCRWSLGVHERDAEALRRLVGENQRKRPSDEPAAGDHDIIRAVAFWTDSIHRTAMPRSVREAKLLKGEDLF